MVFRPRSIVGGVLKLPKERVKATPDYYWSIKGDFYRRIITGSIFYLSLSNAPGREELLVAEAQVPFSHHVSCVAPQLGIFQLDLVKLFQELIKHHVSRYVSRLVINNGNLPMSTWVQDGGICCTLSISGSSGNFVESPVGWNLSIAPRCLRDLRFVIIAFKRGSVVVLVLIMKCPLAVIQLKKALHLPMVQAYRPVRSEALEGEHFGWT